MADVYEFHVVGLLGPVLRCALADLLVATTDRESVLTGTARDPADITMVLRELEQSGILPTQIRISRKAGWHAFTDAGLGGGQREVSPPPDL